MKEECPSFEKCEAPLCPLDDNVNDGIWYPDESICKAWGMSMKYPWIRMQKKIARTTRDQSKYYLLRMLKQNCIVGRGMVGLDPDKERSEEWQLERWLNAHPQKKELSEEEKKMKRKQFIQRIKKRQNS